MKADIIGKEAKKHGKNDSNSKVKGKAIPL
jgi:hypothetical protein